MASIKANIEQKKPAARWRSCFIAASDRVDLSVIKSLLLERGIRPLVLSELIPASDSLLNTVTKAIARADLLIAVLDLESSNSNVYYELGYASALGKPVLVVASPALMGSPATLTELLQTRAEADNREAIGFALDQLRAAPTSEKHRAKAPLVRTKPIGRVAGKLINELGAIEQSGSDVDLLRIVEAALQASGLSIIAKGSPQSFGADMSVWADELAPSIGNPLLIEIRRTLPHTSDAQFFPRGKAHLASSGYWILVLYAEDDHPIQDWLYTWHTNILFLSIRELLNALRTRSFAKVILGLRNQRIHPGSR